MQSCLTLNTGACGRGHLNDNEREAVAHHELARRGQDGTASCSLGNSPRLKGMQQLFHRFKDGSSTCNPQIKRSQSKAMAAWVLSHSISRRCACPYSAVFGQLLSKSVPNWWDWPSLHIVRGSVSS